jgi:hypothetical protein
MEHKQNMSSIPGEGVEPQARRRALCSSAPRIGLALASANRFGAGRHKGQQLGDQVMNMITATTSIGQIIGPVCVKLAIRRAGEVGQAVAENDAWASEGRPM